MYFSSGSNYLWQLVSSLILHVFLCVLPIECSRLIIYKDDGFLCQEDAVIMGMKNLNVFSTGVGDVVCTLEDGHCERVNSVAWCEGSNLFSCDNKNIVEWSIKTRSVVSKWKASKTALTCLAVLPNEKDLLAGGRTIQWWDMKTQKVKQTFTGHAQNITSLTPIVTPSTDMYFVSSSKEDRFINVWYLTEQNQSSQRVASFLTKDAVRDVSVIPGTESSSTKLTTVTKTGVLHIFKRQLNGMCVKPLKPDYTVHIADDTGKSNTVRKIPIIAAYSIEENNVRIVYGFSVFLSFETIALNSVEKVTCLIRHPQKQTNTTKESNVTKVIQHKDDDAEYVTSALSSGISLKRGHKGTLEVPMEQRVNNLSLDVEQQQPEKEVERQLQTGSLSRILIQTKIRIIVLTTICVISVIYSQLVVKQNVRSCEPNAPHFTTEADYLCFGWPNWFSQSQPQPNIPNMPVSGVKGLYNPDNTCWLNIVLQMILSQWSFVRFFIDGVFNGCYFDVRVSNGILVPLSELAKRVWNPSSEWALRRDAVLGAVRRRIPSLQGTNAQDPIRVFEIMILAMRKELSPIRTRPLTVRTYNYVRNFLGYDAPAEEQNPNFFHLLFNGRYLYTYTCSDPHCKAVETSGNYEFVYLQLDLTTRDPVNILTLFMQTLNEYEVDRKCKQCSSNKQKRVRHFLRLPNFLVFTIARLNKQQDGTWVHYGQRVKTPPEIILRLHGEEIYRLNSFVIVTSVGNAERNHAVCVIRHTPTNRWFQMNDNMITELYPGEFDFNNVIVATYTRVGF